MKILEIINESINTSLWQEDETIPDRNTGGVYYFLTRVNQDGNIDGFAMSYRNARINPVSDPDDHVVVSYTMNPKNDSEIIWYDYSKHSNGKGVPAGHYKNADDLKEIKSKFFSNVFKHTQ